MAEPVTLINSFEVPATEADAFVAAWKQARDYLRVQPGYIDTLLHQAAAPNAEFQFVNVAHWRSADDFAAAIGSAGFREAAAGMATYRPHPGLYHTISC